MGSVFPRGIHVGNHCIMYNVFVFTGCTEYVPGRSGKLKTCTGQSVDRVDWELQR